ncbi:MAG: hypothetical protein HY000_40200 [Planctomycetes bacterium]|nr:hypothetical protein [Planctomycetota bacterium]
MPKAADERGSIRNDCRPAPRRGDEASAMGEESSLRFLEQAGLEQTHDVLNLFELVQFARFILGQ